MSTRRHFVLSAPAALYALSAMPKALFAQTSPKDKFAPGYTGAYIQGQMTLAHFAAVVGSGFRVFLDDGSVANLQLQKAVSAQASSSTASSSHSGASGLTSGTRVAVPSDASLAEAQSFYANFSFEDIALTQDTYLFDHATLGQFSAFLVPGSDATTCTVTFNYTTSAAAPVRATPVHSGPIQSGPIQASPILIEGGISATQGGLEGGAQSSASANSIGRRPIGRSLQ